jgi:hypothetical protein
MLVVLVFMRLALALFCVSSASTMQLSTHTAELGHLPPSTTLEPCLAQSPFHTTQVPSWTLSDALNTHCDAGDALQAGAPPALPTTDSSSSFAAFTADGEDEVAVLRCKWDLGPKHKWIKSSHHDVCANVPREADAG